MGQKLSDGKAFDAAAPSGQIIYDYDLYRVAGWNGAAIGAKDATQTDRTMAWEMDTNAIYKVKLPAALAPAVGDLLYWDDPTIFQRGDTDLVATAATAGDPACAIVLIAKNPAGYAGIRILNP